MSEEKSGNPLKISEIVKAINEYSINDLGKDLADLQTRKENVIIYNRIEKDEDAAKKNPLYYNIKAIENIHTKAFAEYTEIYTSGGTDYNKKASLFGHIYTMEQKLIDLEGGYKEDDED